MRWKKYSVDNNKTPEHDQYAKKSNNNWKNYTIEPVYRAILDDVGDRIVLLKQ